jgi:uncharacterized caspase-like protein
MNEVRYAVIIGIDDYDTNPLQFCVNDAKSVKDAIRDKANFLNDNIYLLTSEKNNTVKDITGKLLEVISKIKQNFNKGEDSIFFYFAGHGFQDDGQSYLAFHDSKYPIADVHNIFKDLSPKMQFYVIDACESGNKTITRSVYQEKKNLIKELIENSSGILFLYACQADQTAKEDKTIKHGLMTNYFLEAIKNEKLYDEDGILTPGRIQEYVAKNVEKYSDFSQTPVVENNISGYYPFAMNNPKIDSKVLETEETNGNERGQEVNTITFNRKSRLELQKVSFGYLSNTFREFVEKNFPGYDITYFNKIEDMKLRNTDELLEKIVEDAEGKFASINRTIYKDKSPIYETPSIGNMLNMAYILGPKENRKITGYREKPRINYNSEYLNNLNILLLNSDIWKVSLGLGVVTYQSKWGGVISPYFYRVEWDGESNSIIENITKYNYTYLIEQSSLEQIPTMELDIFNDVIRYNDIWNKYRRDELNDFKIKPKEEPSFILENEIVSNDT